MRLIKVLALAAVLAVSSGIANSANREIYPDPAQAKADLAAALKAAAAQHKRVLVEFGGNWCGDCQVLDIYFHDPKNLPILTSNFELVHINVGHYDANLDLAKQYDVPLAKGVPALAVLDEHGQAALQPEEGRVRSHAAHGIRFRD